MEAGTASPCGDVVLKDLFPELFNIAMDRDEPIYNYLGEVSQENPIFWNIHKIHSGFS